MTAHEEARATTSLVVYEPPAVLNVQQAERRYGLPRTGAVAVRQAWGTGDTGAAQWPAGVELAKLIDSEGPERWRGKRVLEISAGGGAVVAIALMRADAVVAPGFVETDMAAAVLAGPGGDGIRAQSGFGRVATVDEVAEAVAFFTSPGATWCTGAVLDCNGASYLH